MRQTISVTVEDEVAERGRRIAKWRNETFSAYVNKAINYFNGRSDLHIKKTELNADEGIQIEDAPEMGVKG